MENTKREQENSTKKQKERVLLPHLLTISITFSFWERRNFFYQIKIYQTLKRRQKTPERRKRREAHIF
jgi:hypothetical protein